METPTAPTDLPSLAELHEQNARHLCTLLMGMAQQGAALAGILADQMKDSAYDGTPGTGPSHDCTAAYTTVTRSVRQTALLIQKLTAPAPAVKAASDPVAARKQILRKVEDAIDRDAPEEQAERLRAELAERLESPELEEELATRPASEIIEEISRDLGVAGDFSLHFWKRRTPADVAAMCARAAAPYRAASVAAVRPGASGVSAGLAAGRWLDGTGIRRP